jgi:hypothetical protein
MKSLCVIEAVYMSILLVVISFNYKYYHQGVKELATFRRQRPHFFFKSRSWFRVSAVTDLHTPLFRFKPDVKY